MSSNIWHWFIIWFIIWSLWTTQPNQWKHNEGTQEVTSKGLQFKSTSSQFKGTSVWHNQTSAAEQCLAWLSTVTCRQWCRSRRRQWRLWCLQEPGSLRGNIPPASQSPPWPCPSPPATIQPVRRIFRAMQAAADRRLLTSAMRSPSPILSPSFFSQRAMVPVCMVGDSAGSSTWWSEVQFRQKEESRVRTFQRIGLGLELTLYCLLTCHMK